jgi:hypothetical protein
MPTPAAPQDEIFVDLHGVTLAEAPKRLEEELRRAFAHRAKRVVVIHGVGNHNKGGESPLARETREFLKGLLDTPRSAIRKLEFGEESAELSHNAGCARVWLSLDLARDEVAFAPRPSAGTARRAPDPKKLARRAMKGPIPNEEKALREAEDALRRRFGEPAGREKKPPSRPPNADKGEWPGHG